MLKYILLFVNFLILIFAPNFQNGDTVNVSSKFPVNTKPGSTFTVEVTVKKGAVGGFAKFQQELPLGLTASAGEGKGGTFTFVDQKVKFVWVSLPADAEFQISYKVTVAPDASGSKTFGGTFSYLENNESKKFNLTPGTVMVSNDPSAIAAVTPATTPATAVTTTAATTTTTTTTSSTPVPVPNQVSAESAGSKNAVNPEAAKDNSTTAPASSAGAAKSDIATAGLEVIRTMPSTLAGQKEFVVELLVRKQKISGFAKIQEDMPEGFTATAIDSKGATFSFTAQKVKFVWMALPPTGEFKISYKVTVDPSAKGTKSIEGLFSFLDNSESKKFVIAQSNIALGNETAGQSLAAVEKPAVKETVSTIKETVSTIKESATTNTVKESAITNTVKETVAESKNNDVPVAKLAKIPAPVSGIEYKIQISAAKKEIDNPSDFFKTTYNFTDNVNAEMHEGWHKYTSGSFSYYVKAHDFRNDAWAKGIKGSFVVAYNSGSRITVQEALLITKQKWVQ